MNKAIQLLTICISSEVIYAIDMNFFLNHALEGRTERMISIPIETLEKNLTQYIYKGEAAKFKSTWEHFSELIKANRPLQEKLLWISFIVKNPVLFEYILQNSVAPCSEASSHPIIIAMLASSENCDSYFRELLFKYNNNPFGFANALTQLYNTPDIAGWIPSDIKLSITSNIFTYRYHLKWEKESHYKKALREWEEIRQRYTVSAYFMDGVLNPLPSCCSNEDIRFIIDWVDLPMNDLLYLFSNVDINRIITEDGKTPLMYAIQINDWIYIETFLKLGAQLNCVDNKGNSIFQLGSQKTQQFLQYVLLQGENYTQAAFPSRKFQQN